MRAFLFAFLTTLLVGSAVAADRVPPAANAYRGVLTREARHAWGLDANIGLFAGQIHQESRWNNSAKSPVGANGMGQFMPGTGADMNRIYPNDLGQLELYSPLWSIRALVLYDKMLWDGLKARGMAPLADCERYAMMLSAYNGGPGWVERDRSLAKKNGLNPDVWFGNVESNSTRSAAAFRENRGYPQRILYINLPLYLQAGFPGTQPCSTPVQE